MITYTTIEKDQFNLTAEGIEIADSGSHEAKVFNAVDPVNGIAIAELAVCFFFLRTELYFEPALWNVATI
jgi:hypothetical protein